MSSGNDKPGKNDTEDRPTDNCCQYLGYRRLCIHANQASRKPDQNDNENSSSDKRRPTLSVSIWSLHQ